MYTLPAPGVNLNTHNQATLHTSSNCQMPSDSLRQPQTGCVHRFLYLPKKKTGVLKLLVLEQPPLPIATRLSITTRGAASLSMTPSHPPHPTATRSTNTVADGT